MTPETTANSRFASGPGHCDTDVPLPGDGRGIRWRLGVVQLSDSTNRQQNDGLDPKTGLPCYQGVTELMDEHANEDDSDQGKNRGLRWRYGE